MSKKSVSAAARREARRAERAALTAAASALGKLGGKKGGIARARKLSPRRRSEIARMGARARNAMRKPKAA